MNKSTIANRVKSGVELMSNSTVAICSLVRDCESSLSRNIPKVEELRKYFKQSFIIAIENDSVDGTKASLNNWKSDAKNVIVLSEDYGTKTIVEENFTHKKSKYFSEQRISKMATYRNKYLAQVEKLPTVDFVIMVDLDIYDFDINGIVQSFGFEKEWDCISANGKKITPQSPLKPAFYDTYAFQEYLEKEPHNYSEMKKNQKKYATLSAKDDLFRVNSNFNGLAIYRFEAIQDLRYKAVLNNDEVVKCTCEHVTFHAEMAENSYDKHYLNPALIVNYENVGVGLLLEKVKTKLFK